MLRENNSLASLCWLQGNLVRKKSKEKEQQNRCKHRQGRRNCKLIHPPTKVISNFFFDPPPAYIWFVGAKRCSHRFKVSNQISTLPPSLNVGYLDM